MSGHPSHYINNHWHTSDGEEFHSYNPATGQIVWTGSQANKSLVDAAVVAAKEAFEQWADLAVEKRIEYVEAFQEILFNKKEEFAAIISEETGKPLWESKTEVNAMIGKIKISKDAYFQRCKELHGTQGMYASVTKHKPHGALAVFGPYNFPGHLPNGHIIPALIAGNTIILKPSELTPLVSELMLNYWEECHLPKGVMNLVQGGPDTGRLLSDHKNIDGLLFTGSYDTGLNLAKLFGKRPEKILALEMGGNNPFVIGNISEYETAAYLIIHSAYLTAGQRCTCARRLILSNGPSGDQLLNELIPMIKKITVGPYTKDPEPYMGPVINKETAQDLLSKQEELLKQGGSALVEMRSLKTDAAFLSPGLIDVTGIKDRSDLEIFGPLLQVIRVPDFNSAIAEANNTEYGLAAGLLSQDRDQFDLFYKRIRSGIVNWNTPLTGASSQAPFGGIGKSGNHRPSAYYAADYCSYPVSTLETSELKMPQTFPPGLVLEEKGA